MTSEIMSLKEVCLYLKLTASTVYKLTQKDDIPHSKLGKQLRFRKSKVDAWISRREQQMRKKGKKRKS